MVEDEELAPSRRQGEAIADGFARFATTDNPVPGHVRRQAHKHVIDVLGVSVAGTTAFGAHEFSVEGWAQSRYVAPTIAAGALENHGATVWGVEEPLPPFAAAMVNGLHAHAEDFDDTHTSGIVHGSACIVPAAWAAAETESRSGSDLLDAVVIGWEIAARIGIGADGGLHARGWHTTSVAGVFGAAAAAARLLRLSPSETVHALGIAGSFASGINAYLENGSRTKALHAGWAASSGLMAASLARYGMTGPSRVLEGEAGVFQAFANLPADRLAGSLASLGSDWEILRVSTKPYPACHFAHGCIEAALNLRSKGLRPEDIAKIRCSVPQATYPLICSPWEEKVRPANPYIAKFSLPYLVAVAITDGKIQRDTFAAPSLEREEIRHIMDRTEVVPLVGSRFPETFPGRVEVELSDGRVMVEEREVNLGHPERPLSDEQLEQKLRANLQLGKRSINLDATVARLLELEEIEELRTVFA